jgi:hypothetical protein
MAVTYERSFSNAPHLSPRSERTLLAALGLGLLLTMLALGWAALSARFEPSGANWSHITPQSDNALEVNANRPQWVPDDAAF